MINIPLKPVVCSATLACIRAPKHVSIAGLVLLGGLTAPFSGLLAQGAKAQSIKIGDSDLTPTVRLDYVSVDNTFRSVIDQVSSTGIAVSPTIEWVVDRRLLQISAGYRGSYASYSESVLDFDDHALGLNIVAQPGSSHRVAATLSVQKNHEVIGTGQTRFVNDLDDQIESTLVSLETRYTFGARNAQGNISGGLVLRRESFDNLAFLTDGDDNSLVAPFAAFSYRISPDLRAVLETRFGVRRFDDEDRNRNDLSLLAGFDMSATARTSGSVRLGVTQADFERDSVSDTTLLAADVNLVFRPRTFSSITLGFNRDLRTLDDDISNSNETIVDDFRVSWFHQWGARLSTTARYEKEIFDRECPNNGTNTDTLGLQVSVNIRRWIAVGIAGSTTQRAVSDCSGTLEPGAADFDVSQMGVFLKATL